jgi:hypothetical protein
MVSPICARAGVTELITGASPTDMSSSLQPAKVIKTSSDAITATGMQESFKLRNFELADPLLLNSLMPVPPDSPRIRSNIYLNRKITQEPLYRNSLKIS